jgi:hypothetical protein
MISNIIAIVFSLLIMIGIDHSEHKHNIDYRWTSISRQENHANLV